jgi:hypothetical protein
MIWINVYPTGENWPTYYTYPTLSPRMVPDHTYLTWSIYLNGFTTHDKKGFWPNPQHDDWLVRRSIPNFSPITANEAVGKRQVSVDNRLLARTGPICLACDRYVQYLLTGDKLSVLNRYMWGLQSWRGRLFTSHSPTFPTDDPLLST